MIKILVLPLKALITWNKLFLLLRDWRVRLHLMFNIYLLKPSEINQHCNYKWIKTRFNHIQISFVYYCTDASPYKNVWLWSHGNWNGLKCWVKTQRVILNTNKKKQETTTKRPSSSLDCFCPEYWQIKSEQMGLSESERCFLFLV